MDYFIFHVEGAKARKYLKGTNYVGVWADNKYIAIGKVRASFESGAVITPVNREYVYGSIGSLH